MERERKITPDCLPQSEEERLEVWWPLIKQFLQQLLVSVYTHLRRCVSFKGPITSHIDGQKGGILTSNFIKSMTVIVSSKLRRDISDGVVLS